MPEFTFDFTDRASWIAWRDAWRADYREATETIRATKRRLAAIHAERRATAEGDRQALDDRASYLQSDLAGQRAHASRMMRQRTKADERRREMMATRAKAA